MNNHRLSSRDRRALHARSGSAYLLVLGTTMIVTTMVIGASLVLSTDIISQSRRAQMVQASVSAQSALELAAVTFTNSAPERDALNKGAAVLAANVGGLKSVVTATAPDGSTVSANPADPLALIAYSEGVNASQGVRVPITPVAQPITAFDAAVHVGGAISLKTVTVSGGPSIGAQGAITASGTNDVAVPAYSSGLIVGSTFSAGAASSIATRSMPSANSLRYFADLAAPIDYALIKGGIIEQCVIGPGINPYGAASNIGVYSIDCGGQSLTIRNCRISGSLIVYNVGTLTLQNSVNWATPSSNYPVLAMRGTLLRFQLDDAPLSESSIKVNFNPPSLPFEGASDSTTTSILPNAIKGAIYAIADVQVQTILPLEGSLVCTGNFDAQNARCPVTRSTDFVVPPGFLTYAMRAGGAVARSTK